MKIWISNYDGCSYCRLAISFCSFLPVQSFMGKLVKMVIICMFEANNGLISSDPSYCVWKGTLWQRCQCKLSSNILVDHEVKVNLLLYMYLDQSCKKFTSHFDNISIVFFVCNLVRTQCIETNHITFCLIEYGWSLKSLTFKLELR